MSLGDIIDARVPLADGFAAARAVQVLDRVALDAQAPQVLPQHPLLLEDLPQLEAVLCRGREIEPQVNIRLKTGPDYWHVRRGFHIG